MRKVCKVLISLVVLFFVYAIYSSVQAATAGISANKTNVNVGEKVTISVNINAAAWEIHVSGATSGNYSDVTSDGNNSSKTETLSFTPTTAGEYVVNMSGNVTDGSTNAISNVSDKVVVKATQSTVVDGNNEKNPTFKKVDDQVFSTGNINVRKSYTTSSEKLGTLEAGEKVTRTGIGDNGWSRVDYKGSTGYVKTDLLTKEEPKKSEDKTLKSMEIVGYEFEPAFDPEITEYSVIVGKNVEKLDIKAEKNYEKADVSVENEGRIVPGENVVKVTVTAEDGTTRIYSIIVTKEDESKFALSSLKINGYSISPKFSPDVYEYKLTILDPKVISLNVIATPINEDDKVEISGNNSIKQGSNVINVKVTSADGEKTAEYKIIVNKAAVAAGTTKKKNNNTILFAGIGVIGVLVIAIIVILVKARKRNREDYEEDNLYPETFGDSIDAQPVDYKENSYEGSNVYGLFNNENNNTADRENGISDKQDDSIYKKYDYKEPSFGYSFDSLDTGNNKIDYTAKDINTLNDNSIDTIKDSGMYSESKLDEIFGNEKYDVFSDQQSVKNENYGETYKSNRRGKHSK